MPVLQPQSPSSAVRTDLWFYLHHSSCSYRRAQEAKPSSGNSEKVRSHPNRSWFLNEQVLKLLILGMLALLLSGIGGIVGGYIVYLFKRGNFNPTVGIAGVSCVPSTAKVAQKAASKADPSAFILDYALGVNICGVITTAILTGIYITLLS